MISDKKWMKIALEEAQLAMIENEIPVGAVLVQENKLIAQAHNRPIKNNDPTAHAEIEVLRKAGNKLKNYRLPKTTLYVTLEPCSMCFGAIIHARIERIVFGASDSKKGLSDLIINPKSEILFNHQVSVIGGILEDDCKNLLDKFFKLRRKQKNSGLL